MKNIILVLVLFSISFISCVEEDYYQESTECSILVLDISGQISNKIINNQDTGIVEVGIPLSLSIDKLVISSVKLSPLAKADRDILGIRDFSKDVVLKIQAEDNNVYKIWKIRVFYAEEPSQIPYSNMKLWCIARDENGNEIKIGSTYAYFPGQENSFSPWQHSARANTLAGFFTVKPYPSVDIADYASMETRLYSLGSMMNSAIVSGALFTGKFVFDSKYLPGLGSDPNPRKMVNLGTPFSKKPIQVKFKMRYKAGDVMKDGKNTSILEGDSQGRPSKDSCDIYFLLQNRSMDTSKYLRVGSAWLRTGETIGSFDFESGFVEITLDFIYAQPSSQILLENPYIRLGGIRGEVVYYKFSPNGSGYNISPVIEEYAPMGSPVDNIIILMSSSAYGDMFWGAPGSRLDIKDIEFIY